MKRPAPFCLWLRPPAWSQAPTSVGRSTTQAKWLPAETGAGRFMLTYLVNCLSNGPSLPAQAPVVRLLEPP